MNVVLYARVSTIGQETEGQSIQNQQRSMYAAAERNGWTVVRYYHEAASAGTVEGRAEFSRMIAELHKTKPSAIVIQTLDRFTRNLRDGMNLLEELKGHRVGILPIDWRRDKPLNPDDDRDWADIVTEFTAAERERRRIGRRVKDSYEGRRERGAVLANRTPFGLMRRGDHFFAGDRAWIVREAEDRALRGQPLQQIAQWVSGVDERAWTSVRGLKDAFANEHYVLAGARSIERHQELARFLERQSLRHGQRRKYEHEFTGVFLCGQCEALMYGRLARKKGLTYASVVCYRIQDTDREKHYFSAAVSKIANDWLRYVAELAASPDMLAQWASSTASDSSKREQQLTRRLGQLDQSLAALKARRDAAFDLMNDKSAAVQRQARKLLTEADRDEMALAVQREAVIGELARTPVAAKRDPEHMRESLKNYLRVYRRADTRKRNELNLALVAALGSRPRVWKVGPDPMVEWPEVDALSVSARRASSAFPSSGHIS